MLDKEDVEGLMHMISAVQLLGVQVYLSGIGAPIARMLTKADHSFTGVTVKARVQDAVAQITRQG